MTKITPVSEWLSKFIQATYDCDPVEGNIIRKSDGRVMFGSKRNRKGNPYVWAYIKDDSGALYTMAMHRVVWFLYFGTWPVGELDHIDNVHTNNAIWNLREATKSQNNANRSKRTYVKTSSKYIGVSVLGNRFRAQITVQQKNMHLGLFKTEDDAARAYNRAAMKHFGEFARQNVVLDPGVLGAEDVKGLKCG